MKHGHLIRRQVGLHIYEKLGNEDITKLTGLVGALFAESARGTDKCR